MDELAAEFNWLSNLIEDQETGLNKEMTQLIHETNAEYHESYVRAETREMEAILSEIRQLAMEVTEELNDKAKVMKNAAGIFRDEEEEAAKTLQQDVGFAFTKTLKKLSTSFSVAKKAVADVIEEILDFILGKGRNKYHEPSINLPLDVEPLKANLTINPKVYNEQVTKLQQRLKDLGYNIKVDGYFGNQTLKAVNAYKNKLGLANQDKYEGVVDSKTWLYLFGGLTGELKLDPKNYSDLVRLAQIRLNKLGYDIEPTGYFDDKMLKVVNAFKEANQLGNTGNWEGVIGKQTWGVLFSLQKLVVKETSIPQGKTITIDVANSGNKEVRSGGNPSYTEIVNYATKQCELIGLPVDIGLAIIWTESRMSQYENNGAVKKCENKNKEGKVVSVDWGIMQLNDKSWSSTYDFNKIKIDWQYNIRCGLEVALNRYKKAKSLDEKNIPRATYSGYNSWSNIDRYRTENDQRDINFWNNYTNKPWEKLIKPNTPNIQKNKEVTLDSKENISEYSTGTEEERIQYIYGKDAKLWEDFYKTEEEAKKHMKTVTVKIWSYDDKTKKKVPSTKSITINEKLADVIVKIFDEIYNDPEQFPINWDTGAFNWRGDGSKSMHNQGMAIDINWEENAMLNNSGGVMSGKLYKPGENVYSIPKGSSVVRAFKKYGWYWGGEWNSKKDYMHFAYLNR